MKVVLISTPRVGRAGQEDACLFYGGDTFRRVETQVMWRFQAWENQWLPGRGAHLIASPALHQSPLSLAAADTLLTLFLVRPIPHPYLADC